MSNLSDDVRHARRQLAERSPRAFVRTYLPESVRLALSLAHEETYTLLQEILQNRGKKLAVAAPRGFGKTTLISQLYALYCTALRKERFIVLLSATAPQAIQMLEHIRKELETNQKLRADFPELAGPKPRPWTRNEIETPHGVRLLALGMGQAVRGRKHGRFRPTLVIADDVENRQNTWTDEARTKVAEWHSSDILNAGTQETNHLFLGTVVHPECLLAKFLDPQQHPEWIKRRYPAVVSGPSHAEYWERWSQIYNGRERYEEATGPEAGRRFYEAHQALMDEGAAVLWPAKWTYYGLRLEYERDPISFSSDFQNEPLSPKDCIFDPDSYHYWDDRWRSKEELVTTLGNRLTYYMGIDPSVGEDTARGDFTAIVIAARDQKDGTLYVLEADLFRAPTDQIVETIIVWGRRYHFTRIAVEANQYQVVVAQHLQRRSQEVNLYLPVEPVKNTTNKVSRVQRLQPLLKCGAIQLCRSHRLLLEQLRYFPKGRYDDGPDALELVVRAAEEPPTPEVIIVGGGGGGGWDSDDWNPFYRAMRGGG